eukprot:COSAG06_NODE_274_length_18646_cov_21.468539_8_plen_108_part_00
MVGAADGRPQHPVEHARLTNSTVADAPRGCYEFARPMHQRQPKRRRFLSISLSPLTGFTARVAANDAIFYRMAVILGRGRVTCLRRSADKGFGGSDVFTAEVAQGSL